MDIKTEKSKINERGKTPGTQLKTKWNREESKATVGSEEQGSDQEHP